MIESCPGLDLASVGMFPIANLELGLAIPLSRDDCHEVHNRSSGLGTECGIPKCRRSSVLECHGQVKCRLGVTARFLVWPSG